MEPWIEPTVHDLANRIKPRVVAPEHCTGWRARRCSRMHLRRGTTGRVSSARSALRAS
jgi:7,8-dihydropterin-6-yl-methyl-4-(beta-D-ribofuranosyl)aminobenzene 5'-phosphate synthase